MPATQALRNLGPETIVQDATRCDLRSFLADYGDAPLLLVRIPEGDTELELGLKARAGAARAQMPKPLPFRTTHRGAASESRRLRAARYETPAGLRQLLEKHACFAVPLHKREGDDSLFTDRISVGRVQNKDVVLRHVSVSKFHAWFEMDESGTLYVCDGGSTNLTHVDGSPIEPRTAMIVDCGDSIRFGAVETVLCAPETLWACLNGDDPKAETAARGDD